MFKSIKGAAGTYRRIQQLRNISTKLVNTAINNEGISIIEIQRKPVNALSTQLLTEIRDALECAENNRVRGILLTSGIKNIFSAGLNIKELYKPTIERFTPYWSCFKDVLLKLNMMKIPTAAVVNGHAIAGGCLLPLSCEYRIMVSGYTIGMNETKLGMPVPPWAHSIFTYATSRRQSELALTSGVLFTTEQALTIGLIDQIAANEEDAHETSELFFKQFDQVDFIARKISKQSMKTSIKEALTKNHKKDTEHFFANLIKPHVQQKLEEYAK